MECIWSVALSLSPPRLPLSRSDAQLGNTHFPSAALKASRAEQIPCAATNQIAACIIQPVTPSRRSPASPLITIPPGPARDGHAARAVQDVALLYSTHAGAAVQQRQGAAGAQQAPASGEPRWCSPGC